MAEYYERETLIDALMMYTWRDEDDREIDDSDEKRAWIEGWFPNIPAADVVEVVRCKDCKHYALSGCTTYGIHICKNRGGVVGDNDYCSRAEREEEP